MIRLVEKMKDLGLLKFELIFGSIISLVVMISIPVVVFSLDISLIANLEVVGFVVGIDFFVGLVGYFLFVRPYIVYRKIPVVQVEADNEFLYIHTKKEVKIPFSEIEYVYIDAVVPFLLQEGFLREFIIHKFSYDYGSIVMEIENHGKYKLKFVANAEDVADELLSFISDAINK